MRNRKVLIAILIVSLTFISGCKSLKKDLNTDKRADVIGEEIHGEISKEIVEFLKINNLKINPLDTTQAKEYIPLEQLLKSSNSILYEIEEEGFIFILRLPEGETLDIPEGDNKYIDIGGNLFVINTKNYNKQVSDVITNFYNQ